MQNSPHFILIWLAILKIGAIPGFINNNLTDVPLLHCLKTSTARLLIFDPACVANIEPYVDKIRGDLGIEIWSYGAKDDALSFCEPLTERTLKMYGEENLSDEFIRGTKQHDIAMLIYTSGTTGLPKPAIFHHAKANVSLIVWGHMYHLRPDDRVYCTLPLYHSSASILCLCMSWGRGCTVVLAEKFSISRFWDECRQNDVTAFIYIGEICRYLLAAPPSPHDKQHKVRLAYGNGMRPDIWNRFRERFGVKEIGEFYAATEGIGSLFNLNTGEFGSGAVGHRGRLIRSLTKDMRIIRIDLITEEAIRGPNGFCIECAYDEPGELVVENQKDGPLEFQGYFKNKEATNKKIMKNVFTKGDVYFRTGDILKLNPEGYFTFADRIGDTFRWKSENVSTAEVAQVLGLYPAIQEANVYGCYHDQRQPQDRFQGTGSVCDHQATAIRRAGVSAHPAHVSIPAYTPFMEITGTFKQRKVELRTEGVDPDKTYASSDAIYWLTKDGYQPFGRQEWESIVAGKSKL
ncbi:hypothetical protein BC937DRAFT_91279 [Endogone sp. FLAS-F59071]|nr:hypothetical protein BC937DRAFT_91279 [Endogone sp. FLAS-F59071]|eukprot:RUS16379.1 hypothetical protein BC937DRAFT_91279 [Endogone sp. FLAS-F59071]